MTAYETIYPGGNNGLNPAYESIYKPITYKTEASTIGLTLDGRTANQLKDVGQKLASGATVLEVSGASSAILESMPKQHLKEISRQMKLAGAQPTMHGPVVEASGITQQGWDESDRLGAEKQLTSALLRGHELDPKGNISVTTHSSAGLPELEEVTKTKQGEKLGKVFVVDPRTGQWNLIKAQKRFFPEKGEFKKQGREFKAQEEIDKYNKNNWTQNISNINRYTDYGEDTINSLYKERAPDGSIKEKTPEKIQEINNLIAKAQKLKDTSRLDPIEKQRIEQFERAYNHGTSYFRDAYQNMKQMFDIAYSSKDISENEKKELREFAEYAAPIAQEGIENDPRKIKEFVEMIEKGLKTLGKQTPKTVVPLKEFVIDKSSETFANAATAAYDKYGKTTPILNIENPPAGGALSRGEDLKKLVVESRKKMAENLVRDKNLSRGEAKKIAEKTIGATWDVGHINMLRKKGYSEEDIIKETEKIAPFVKHVHLSDNFGFEHTELPMGMGNVPIKKIMEKLGEKGFEGKKIVEAAQWFEHFQDAPGQPPKMGGHALAQTMQAFDSPIYTTGVGYSWGQMPGLSAYVPGVGQGAVAPPISQSMYGTTFSTLPQELGGAIGGDQSRFSGTPNQ